VSALDAKPVPPAPVPPVPRDPMTGEPLPAWATWQPMVQPNLLDVDALPDGPPTVRDPDPWRG
jgi:hypothetical protein